MPLPLVWLDGRLIPLEEARISPLDRGFLFGDGAYEVLPVYGGRAYRFEPHMARLDRSLGEIRMAPPLDRAGWLAAFGRLVHGNGGGDLLLYVQVTRGVEPERNHVPQAGTRPTVFACVQKLPAIPASAIEHGVAAVTAEDIRWSRCDIKSTSLLGNVLLRWLAADAGATETLLLRGGFATEGSASSVHLVTGGRIVTPPQTNAILPGTTRGVIFELAQREGIASERRQLSEAELRAADEILIASAGGGIRAVTTLDGRPVGGGAPGAVYRRIYAAFKATQCEFSTELPA
jgi:D-alanine transaminase